MDWVLVVGRVLFSLIFIASALAGHFAQNEATAGYAESRGLSNASTWVYISGVWMLLGGLGVALGIYTDIAALMLVVYLLAAMFVIHHFWSDQDEMTKTMEMTQFMKNLSMVGGGLIIFAFYSNEALQLADAIGWELVGPLLNL